MQLLRVLISAGMVIVLLSGLAPLSADAAQEQQLSIYGFVETFTWKEYGDFNERLLKESGPLIGIGMSFQLAEVNSLAVNIRGELFGGQVDYDGQTQAGDPVFTDVNYFGLKGEGDLGYRYGISRSSFLEPFAGLGFRWWLRDINSGTTIYGDPAMGYEELWYSLYLRLGLRAGHAFSKDKHAFAEFGVKLPVYNENYIDDFAVTLEPGLRASLFAEAGMKFDRIKLSAFYEGFRFSESDPEFLGIGPMGPEYIYQPESESDTYGVRVGVVF